MSAGLPYLINEQGNTPGSGLTGVGEVFTAGGQQIMIPTVSGSMAPASQTAAGGGGQINWTFNTINNMAGVADVSISMDQEARIITTSVNQAVNAVAGQMMSNTGPVGRAQRSSGIGRKLTGGD